MPLRQKHRRSHQLESRKPPAKLSCSLALLASLCCGLHWPAYATDHAAIAWIFIDLPPVSISSGRYQGQGFQEALLENYRQAMPDYTHQTVYLGSARIYKLLLDKSKNFCIPSMYKLAMFSESRVFGSFNHITGLELLTLKKNLGPIQTRAGGVVLNELLKNTELILGFSHSRSFPALDSLIQAHATQRNIVRFSLQRQETLFHMLLRGRIHYTLGGPYEAGYIGQVLDRAANFLSLPIAEAPQTILGYPSCTNNQWGKDIIQRINKLNRQPALHRANLALIHRWADPATAERLAKEYRRTFHKTHGQALTEF